jgi:DNA repair exonuclease SbcCD ATPase subunit
VTKTLGGYSDSNLLSLATTVAIGYQQWSDGHDAMTDNLRAQLAERGMELVIKEMRIDSLTAALDDVRNRWHDAEQDWMQLRAQLAERSREIAELRAAIVRLCGNAKTTLDLNEWLEIYAPEQWFAGYDVAESALMALKDYSESIVYLRAQVATLTERLSRCTCTDDDGNEAP